MARKTDGEKIDELVITVAILTERVDGLIEKMDALGDLAGRVVVLEQRMNALEQRFADLRHGREQWLHRAWMLLAPLVGAVVGSLLTYYLNARK